MSFTDRGIIDLRCQGSVAQVIDRLQAIATSAGLLVFARIDFSGDAQRAGLSMRPMQALLFGNPKAGTPILVATPRAGLDLPLRANIGGAPALIAKAAHDHGAAAEPAGSRGSLAP